MLIDIYRPNISLIPQDPGFNLPYTPPRVSPDYRGGVFRGLIAKWEGGFPSGDICILRSGGSSTEGRGDIGMCILYDGAGIESRDCVEEIGAYAIVKVCFFLLWKEGGRALC